MKALSAKRVSFSYITACVINDITLGIDEGEFVGIIGPNGAGKSTLLRLLCGILQPASGTSHVFKHDMSRMNSRERAQKIAFIPQETHFALNFTVQEIVTMGRFPYLRAFQRTTERDHDAVMRALVVTHTEDFRSRPILSLSSGERQRVVLARALAQEPLILLLDEPSSHLDIHHQHSIMELLKSLHNQDVTIVIVHHDLNLASLYCQRLILLHEGRIHAQGGPEEIITKDILRTVYQADVEIVEHPYAHIPQIMLKSTGGRA